MLSYFNNNKIIMIITFINKYKYNINLFHATLSAVQSINFLKYFNNTIVLHDYFYNSHFCFC